MQSKNGSKISTAQEGIVADAVVGKKLQRFRT
jgi:hypothetical protein